MGTEGFSNDDLREAAAEAGISPAELRDALVEREGGPKVTTALARTPGTQLALEGAIAAAPPRALTLVRESIERQTGLGGHHQGEARYDIVNDREGLTYRVHVRSDEAGGALVRVDVDATAGALVLSAGTLGSAALLSIAIGLLASVPTLWLGGFGLAAVTGLWIAARLTRVAQARRRAESIAAQALVDAEHR